MDCFLPETMNWLEKLLEESSDKCEHHIYSSFYKRPRNEKFKYVDAGINCSYPVSILSKIKNKINQASNIKQLDNYIHQQKIQLIHFHFGNVAIQYKDWIQKTGLPFCVSLYGFDYEYLVYKNRSIKSDYVFLSKLGGRFIVEGDYSRKLIQRYGISIQQIHIVHMLYDRQHQKSGNFFNVAEFPITYSQPIKLFQAATFTEKKNQLGLVEALQDRHASCFIISFYGEQVDKIYFQELEKAVKSKYKHCIQIHDKISLDEYLNALDNSHFTINLSKRSKQNDTEGGCPVILKDGLSLGKPGISTNHCDIPEIIVNGCNGFLLPENDHSAVTELLDRLLLLSQKEYTKLCCNARESVKTNISQKITEQDLLSVYKSMI